jgi:hypothetical protein
MLGKHMGAEYIIFGFPRGAFRVVAERNMRRLDYLHEANMVLSWPNTMPRMASHNEKPETGFVGPF